jgi:hypothetical protein
MSVEYAESSSRPFASIERSLSHVPDRIRLAINRNRMKTGLQPYRRMIAAKPFEVDPFVRADAIAALARLQTAMASH